MKKLIIALIAVLFTPNLFAQTQTPGLDVLGYGYDVFGNYADQASKKKYCLFKYSNFTNTPIGSQQYSVPQYVFLENISKHKVSTVSGESMREYAKTQSASVGLGVDAMFFSGSINSSFSQSSSGSERHFYYTYRDANTKWRVSFDERNYANLYKILDPQFKQDLANMEPAKLFEIYGTHYIASAYLGGRADFNTKSVITSNTNTRDLSVAIEAQYQAVSGNVSVSKSQKESLSNSKTTSKLTVTGGNSEFANNISDPATYEKWASGIAGMPVLCDFDENSLKPIWDFCTNTDRKDILKAAFKRLLRAHPLPAAMAASMRVSNQVYFVKNMADNMYIDIPGYNMDAHRQRGTKVTVYPKDNAEQGLQGIDRFIKVIPHATEHDYVYLQPQHSDLVLDIKGGKKDAGTPVHLWSKGNNNVAQMFKLIDVDGKKGTYYIQNKNSGLYLTSHGKNKALTQEKITKEKNQQWAFEKARAEDMASIKKGVAFAFKNVMGKRYMDLGGNGKNAQKKDGDIKLWDMDNGPDRYAQLIKSNIDGYYYVQQMHSKCVWDIAGGNKKNGTVLQLWDKNNTPSQQFKFIYAGSAMTFKIQNKGSGKYIDASSSNIDRNGCRIQIWSNNNKDNQKWKLEPAGPQKFAPEKPVKVKVKVAFSNKYWDIEGGGQNAKVKGKKLQIWSMDGGADRYFTIKRSGDGDWIWFETGNGSKRIDVHSGKVNVNGTGMGTWDPHGGVSQKFAIYPTGRYTCVITSHAKKALDVRGGKINEDGPDIIIWDMHYGASQQYQLIDSSNKPIDFTKYLK